MYLCRTFMSFLKLLSLKQVSRSRLPFVTLNPLHVFNDLGTDRVTGLQWKCTLTHELITERQFDLCYYLVDIKVRAGYIY